MKVLKPCEYENSTGCPFEATGTSDCQKNCAVGLNNVEDEGGDYE